MLLSVVGLVAGLAAPVQITTPAPFAQVAGVCASIVLTHADPDAAARRVGYKFGIAFPPDDKPNSPPTVTSMFFGQGAFLRMIDTKNPGRGDAPWVLASANGERCWVISQVKNGTEAVMAAEQELMTRYKGLKKVGSGPASGGEMRVYGIDTGAKRFVVTNSWGVKDGVTKSMFSIRPSS